MAEKNQDDKAVYDGRFGKYFDDEVSVSSVVWSTVLLAACCVIGMVITWYMNDYYANRAEAAKAPPSPVAEANLLQTPQGPLLQRSPGSKLSPEGELEEMRHAMDERLHGFGWVDEHAGVVHIPIDEAMDLLVAQGAGAIAERTGE